MQALHELSQLELSMQQKAARESSPRTARTSATFLQPTRVQPAGKFSSCLQSPHRRLEGHACCQGPIVETQSTPIGRRCPFQGGGLAPPFLRLTKPREGEINGIQGHRKTELACLLPSSTLFLNVPIDRGSADPLLVKPGTSWKS